MEKGEQLDLLGTKSALLPLAWPLSIVIVENIFSGPSLAPLASFCPCVCVFNKWMFVLVQMQRGQLAMLTLLGTLITALSARTGSLGPHPLMNWLRLNEFNQKGTKSIAATRVYRQWVFMHTQQPFHTGSLGPPPLVFFVNHSLEVTLITVIVLHHHCGPPTQSERALCVCVCSSSAVVSTWTTRTKMDPSALSFPKKLFNTNSKYI